MAIEVLHPVKFFENQINYIEKVIRERYTKYHGVEHEKIRDILCTIKESRKRWKTTNRR